MTLTIDLSEELQTRLRTAARANGTDEAEAVRQVLESALPPIEAGAAERARRARELFAKWDAEDANMTEEECEQAERDWQAFQQNMNANRAATGERPVF
jgi:tRNA A37 N6-isopentenylltransferase MiaA